ncbi:MAG: hypothetical protein CMM02_06320 [Rhodopirellula sp.]|nr:hypothetical protein [Rhodopirellula sp.]|tara:strand:- start:1369 stop:2316 length:948 start_codon:yes stop_codon:yes gene_type:complete
MIISFIIIGKNVEGTIDKTLSSIYKLIDAANFDFYEVIYVDSNSQDSTINIVNNYNNVKKFKVWGKPNAAIARNIGANNSKGDILFFIDGDMEIIVDSTLDILKRNQFNDEVYMASDFYDFNYVANQCVSKKLRYNLNKDEYDYQMGGFFIIAKKLWDLNGGMRSCFKRSQDLDFSLRMANMGYYLIKYKNPCIVHHTIDYMDNRRFIKDLLRGNYLFPSLLIKYNLLNKHVRNLLFRQITAIALSIIIILSLLLKSSLILLSYLGILLFKIIIRKELKDYPKYLIIYFLLDLNFVFSTFFYWPVSEYIKNDISN